MSTLECRWIYSEKDGWNFLIKQCEGDMTHSVIIGVSQLAVVREAMKQVPVGVPLDEHHKEK